MTIGLIVIMTTAICLIFLTLVIAFLTKLEKEKDIFENQKSVVETLKCVMDNIKQLETFKKNLKERDYLIKTKFLGNLKNKNIIKNFKKNLIIYCNKNNFEKIIEEIGDYNFENMDAFFLILKEYEEKQEIINNYCNIKKE